LRCGPVQPLLIITGLAQPKKYSMKKTSNPSSVKAVSKNGRPLHGTAAQLRVTSLAGGWDKQQREIMASAAAEAVDKLWLKIVTNYKLAPNCEPESPEQRAKSGACEIPHSAKFNPSTSSYGHH
jgi:hypothetical protein